MQDLDGAAAEKSHCLQHTSKSNHPDPKQMQESATSQNSKETDPNHSQKELNTQRYVQFLFVSPSIFSPKECNGGGSGNGTNTLAALPQHLEVISNVKFGLPASMRDVPHFSLLCMNCYLVPPLISWNPYFWASFWSCKNSPKRSKLIGNFAQRYDLICLQEVWGTNLLDLNSAVAATHSILPEAQTMTQIRCLNEIVDPLRLYCRSTGGLWIGWRRSKFQFKRLDRKLFDPIGQVPLSNQNITVLELDANPIFLGKRIILFCTHFSTFSQIARENNLKVLKNFVSLTLWADYLYQKFGVKETLKESFQLPFKSTRQHKGYSQSLVNVENCVETTFKDTAVLLCGDFNIDSEKSAFSYNRLLTLDGIAKLRDLFVQDENPNFPFQKTYYSQERSKPEANNKKGAGNSLFPWPFDGRVDYIFAIDEVRLAAEEISEMNDQESFAPLLAVLDKTTESLIYKNKDYRIIYNKIKCIGMDILTQPYGQELSDHWPLSALLTIVPPTEEAFKLKSPEKVEATQSSNAPIIEKADKSPSTSFTSMQLNALPLHTPESHIVPLVRAEKAPTSDKQIQHEVEMEFAAVFEDKGELEFPQDQSKAPQLATEAATYDYDDFVVLPESEELHEPSQSIADVTQKATITEEPLLRAELPRGRVPLAAKRAEQLTKAKTTKIIRK